MKMQKEQISKRVAAFEACCKAHGLSLTVQRRIIFESVLRGAGHPTADEVFEAVTNRMPGVSRTTVYRVLETLVRIGVIRRYAHAGGVARFDANADRHDHLVCVRCAKVVDVPAPKPGGFALPDASDLGFEIHDFTIEFRGLCAECARTVAAEGQRAK